MVMVGWKAAFESLRSFLVKQRLLGFGLEGFADEEHAPVFEEQNGSLWAVCRGRRRSVFKPRSFSWRAEGGFPDAAQMVLASMLMSREAGMPRDNRKEVEIV